MRSASFRWFAVLLPALLSTVLGLSGCGKSGGAGGGAKEIINVSYDPTREFYAEFNKLFVAHWQKETGQAVKVTPSHGGSGKQARSVIEGNDADVVTLALAYDIDAIRLQAKLIEDGWAKRLPNNSCPYTSTIVFLVRKGNPKGIKDWGDLVRDGVAVITPNPQTSGGARWNYLAAWGYVLKQELKDLGKLKNPAAKAEVAAAEVKAAEFMRKLFKNVPVLDTGARGSTNTFVQREVGDVLLAWENEALLTVKDLGAKFEIVTPSISIRAEPPVAVVDKIVDKRKTRAIAEGYLKYLYSAEAQDLAARHNYRPSDEAAAKRYADRFARVEMFSVDDLFGGWAVAQKTHFDKGGTFEKVSKQ